MRSLRSRFPRVLLAAIAVFSASGRARADGLPGWLFGWVARRAEEQSSYFAAQSMPHLAPTVPGDRLWNELPAGAAIPQFVPPTSLAPLIQRVRGAVVNISTRNGRGPSSAPFERGASRSLGSGFLLSPDGFVVTNNHVIERAQAIQVKVADGRVFFASVVGRDPSTDVALLKLGIDGGTPLPFAHLGDSDGLEVGDWVVAIGNPFGLDHSVAHGMISAKERVIGVGIFDDFIQTDALINPGNSGGPLFNMRGEVIGVNTAIVSQGQGIGFAVPINMVKDLLPNLRVNGRLARGWLGVNIEEAVGEDKKGAVIRDVFRGSPAALAGLRAGDLVVAVNGKPIETYQQLLRRVALLAPGSDARLLVTRAGAGQEVTVRLKERPSPETLQVLAASEAENPMGILARALSPEVAESLQLPPYAGVLVTGVLPRSPAEAAGLEAGDLITEVNGQRVKSPESLKTSLKDPRLKTAVIRYLRGDDIRHVEIARSN